jgi:hypothetical protein
MKTADCGRKRRLIKIQLFHFTQAYKTSHTDLHVNCGPETIPGVDSLVTQLSLNPQKLVILGETLTSS